MSPRKREKTFGGKITTPQPSWLSETESNSNINSNSILSLSKIELPPNQPRRYFDEQALLELAGSIKLHGILQPLLVRPIGSNAYQLVAGERRYRAAKLAQLESVPVVVKELDDETAWQLALIENLQREDLNPIEETEGILQLLAIKLDLEVEEVPKTLYRLQKQFKNQVSTPAAESGRPSAPKGGASLTKSDLKSVSEALPSAALRATHNVMGKSKEMETESAHNVMGNPQWYESETQNQELAAVESVFDGLGKMSWVSFVKNRLPLLHLPEDIAEALATGQIAYTKAKAIAQIKDQSIRTNLLEESIAQSLSLSQIRERIKQLQPPSDSTETELPQRLKRAYQKVKKIKQWSDPRKRKKIETLLGKLEALIDES